MKYEWIPEARRYVLRAESVQDVRFLTALRDSCGVEARIEVSGSEPVPATSRVAGLPPDPAATLGIVLHGAVEIGHADPMKPYTSGARASRGGVAPQPQPVSKALGSLLRGE